ncbi:hypothetical protein [Streptomyces sp. NBC_00328]|uniref:hypothetical protein n=1 Tax=Streptomyces sp. NBC_00328 TaxID=2903646 RepID=UPI002E2C8478|nr:hypothetical protein [Streptomyces sp. NBC_00328]
MATPAEPGTGAESPGASPEDTPVTLSEAENNTTDAIDVQVIDEFRKASAVLDALAFDDVVNPAGGGAT